MQNSHVKAQKSGKEDHKTADFWCYTSGETMGKPTREEPPMGGGTVRLQQMRSGDANAADSLGR
jgi:hypothetical protein